MSKKHTSFLNLSPIVLMAGYCRLPALAAKFGCHCMQVMMIMMIMCFTFNPLHVSFFSSLYFIPEDGANSPFKQRMLGNWNRGTLLIKPHNIKLLQSISFCISHTVDFLQAGVLSLVFLSLKMGYSYSLMCHTHTGYALAKEAFIPTDLVNEESMVKVCKAPFPSIHHLGLVFDLRGFKNIWHLN